TCGIEAAIMTACKSGSSIIMNRGCHQSAYNACILARVKPIFVKEEIDKENNILMGARPEDYLEAIRSNPQASAVFITRPSYYGMSQDIDQVVELAHEYQMLVIVDEAHGAHFGLSHLLPKSAVYSGADMVIQSVHKTLPSLTQSSILIYRKRALDTARLTSVLSMVETSSPSYVMLMSIEVCYDIYEKSGRVLMQNLMNNIYRFKRGLKDYKVFTTSDPSKIFVNTIEKGINGYDFAKVLRHRYNIQVELSNYSGVLFLATIANTKSDFDKTLVAMKDILDRKLFSVLADFKEDISEHARQERFQSIGSIYRSRPISLDLPVAIPERGMDLSQAFDADKEDIRIEESLGRISGEFVIPYPPGVAILAPGELVDQDLIDFLVRARDINIDINGMESHSLETIKVIK
ncbi:MAG: aminotransferase class I/II-fold pyridoxal phosphate-dependent enzyme, partial [Peptostreptococcus sp.]|nr:aminotransferase class I/II-fold pyridoxal phosphate-dependent enzyme [Peptostreptococcus sp.]